MANGLKFLVVGLLLTCSKIVVQAAGADELGENPSVSIEDAGTSELVDPEHPDQVISPNPGPATSGSLRFDYISPLNFGHVPIKEKDRTYYAQAQYFQGSEEPRGFYIQISDRRSSRGGWTLQVKQTQQFKSEDGKELAGATLSFDKGWINSLSDETPPILSRDTVNLSNINQAYEIARADKGTGNGIWLLSFGASPNNALGQPTTMIPVMGQDGKQQINDQTKKLMYQNNAVSLKIPDQTKIEPVKYHTELIWILSKLP